MMRAVNKVKVICKINVQCLFSIDKLLYDI